MFPVYELINTTNDKALTRTEKKELLRNLQHLDTNSHTIVFSIIRRFYLINKVNEEKLFDIPYSGKIINNSTKKENEEDLIINDLEFSIDDLPCRLSRMLIQFFKLDKK